MTSFEGTYLFSVTYIFPCSRNDYRFYHWYSPKTKTVGENSKGGNLVSHLLFRKMVNQFGFQYPDQIVLPYPYALGE